ncbi:efflux transporter periplasmic adaptor subunit [Pseudoxanthomonas broegbernensis]|uniref:Efflux transporter periplasmic adaptor subunit n=1 Tax=Pseudoxanthomonas broegbernensis TaxID=83619 RepID=A0A7V8K5R3_9GAMM|nr:efflux RND transporter periplasmic adaptor subunit [Pseudoxanthomonas broegbernensis]KAF1684735.1 efflux transporter periplasmic adaptor subunit [Pseudoxanthomonas broegbernensis]MBB6066397.1 membrane fusion protein (multidrug efflux system) [Pseudoxanthomonas broegbernensis]
MTTHRPLLLACGLLALAACSSEEAAAPPPPEVGVVKAQPQTVPLQRDLVGRLSPYRSADVRARVPGVLLKRTYQEGSDVKEGQVLFEIDPAPLQAALGVARGQLAQAEATYANARTAAERARQLAPQKYVSQNDLDNAVAAERSAAAAAQAARATVRNAEIDLGYARVAAPIAGRAGKQQVTEGALVGQGDATLLATVDQLDPLYANFSIGSTELEQLRSASNVALSGAGKSTVQLLLPGGRVYAQPGTLDFSDATVDPATGTVSLRAVLPNPDGALLPGSFVTLKANLGELHDVFLVPQPAVLRDANGAYLYVVGDGDKVVRKTVAANTADDGRWLVTSGLAAGDQVIVAGVQKVKEGAQVQPAPWKPEAGDGAAPAQAAEAATAAPAGEQPAE